MFLVLTGIVLLGTITYTVYPAPKFPDPPPNAVQSMEDADIEDPLRRAYFTNYTREQVVDHYKNQFRFKAITLELNYPPEDAQTLIRDQTRSRYLEELVHPLRESLYINGFIPQDAKDDIWYKGVHYEEKITIRYVQSSLPVRTVVALVSASSFVFVIWQLIFVSSGRLKKK